MDIKPIKNARAYNRALREIERLWNARPGSPAHDKLDVLATLVEAYERQHHEIAPPDPIEAIRFRMEQLGLSRKDLEPYIGGRARVAEVLNRKRRLSLPMIRKLHEGLGIPADVLIHDPLRATG
jgi:HTH-type transcriptional regulator/antitoxin HigA